MLDVWLINHYAQVPNGPGGTRHYSLARHLRMQGWRMTVVASGCEYGTGKQRLTSGEFKRLENFDAVDFLWLRTLGEPGCNALRRLLAMLSFSCLLLWPWTTRCLPRPDVVIGSTVHPFAAFAAWILSCCYRVPFVFEVRDLWPRTLVAMGAIKSGSLAEGFFAFLESWLAHRAAFLIVLMPGAINYYQRLGIPADRLLWLPNGAEIPHSEPEPLRSDPHPFRLVYCGSHGIANSLDTIIDSIAYLQSCGVGEDQLVLHLIGDGPLKPALEQRVRLLGLRSVSFYPPVPKQDLLRSIVDADGFVVAMHDLPDLYRYGISFNKLFDYFAAARPIISASCASFDPVELAQAGIVVPAGDYRALAQAINRLRLLPLNERKAQGDRGRAYLLAHHSYPMLAQRLAEKLDALVRFD